MIKVFYPGSKNGENFDERVRSKTSGNLCLFKMHNIGLESNMYILYPSADL